MMQWIYDLGFLIFGIFTLPHFLMRLRQAENPAKLVRERLGFFSRESVSRLVKNSCLWIHCVSVGEVLAIEKLMGLILERRPDLRIVLTTVTPTGQRMARRFEGERVSVFYFPFDFRFAVSSFFETFKPVCLLLVETEIWPNVIAEARRRRVPVLVVNGRISERSFRSFRRFSPIFQPLLNTIDGFLVQTEEDRKRLVALGVSEARIQVTGNMKLDAFDLNGQEEDAEMLRKQWGFLPSDQILIGGSTHAGEEEILLRVTRRLTAENFPVKLLLAPRHIERAKKIFEMTCKAGFQAILASSLTRLSQASRFEVLILDQLGILRKLYALGDAVFMGGSLVRHGGQNPIEPASFSRPILHGPWVFNFHDIYHRLEEEGASLRVGGEEELVFALKRILASDRERQHLGNRAHEVLKKLRGASERNFNTIHSLIRREPKREVSHQLLSTHSRGSSNR